MALALQPDRMPAADLGSLDALADWLAGNPSPGAPVPSLAWPAEALEFLGRMELWRLPGMAASAFADPRRSWQALQQLALAGSASAFVLQSDGERATIGVGTLPARAAALARGLHAALGGPLPEPLTLKPQDLELAENEALAGTPAACPIDDAGRTGVSPADLLLDSLAGEAFLYAVLLTPEPRERLAALLGRARAAAEAVDRAHLRPGQQGDVDRAARRARELLDLTIRDTSTGLAEGRWRVTAFLGCSRTGAAREALALVARAIQAPPGTVVSPLHAAACVRTAGAASPHASVLSAAEAATLCPLPRRDRMGFAIRKEAPFDVDLPVLGAEIRLGRVIDGAVETGRWFSVSRESLTRHVFVTGHTGAGKSTTVRMLLSQLDRLGTPFLVLEPAKAEYRELAGAMPGLCVLEAGAPLRPGRLPFSFNPLAFPHSFPLHTHIDHVGQAFAAAFGMAPPLPFLLETALHRVYESRGWDLTTGFHPHAHEPLSYPILEELLDEIDPAIDAAAYARDIAANLRAALRTRIGSLCGGSKGAALNVREGLPDSLLFDRPAVIELRQLGSDDEKALVMGFLLTRLYERRQAAGAAGKSGLRHLLVIEEAHRLLRHRPERAREDGNMAHQAVETFANMLSEVRAYGQGVLVAEQIPTKLAPEVLKQSSLKIAHRLTPADDRNAVGDGMALDTGQKRHLATLEPGEAVAHTEGMDGAMLIRVPPPPARPIEVPDDLDRRLEASLTGSQRASLARAAERSRLAAWLRQEEVRAAGEAFVLALLAGRDEESAASELAARLTTVGELPGGSAERTAARMAVLDALERRASRERWSQKVVEVLEARIGRGEAVAPELRRTLAGVPRRHAWCAACPAPCLFRHEGQRLASDPRFLGDLGHARAIEADGWGAALREAVEDAAVRWLDGQCELPSAAARCALGFGLDRLGARPAAIVRLLEQAGFGQGVTP